MIIRICCLIFVFLIHSCSISKELKENTITGKYVWTSQLDTGAYLILKNDGTFEYEWWQGLALGNTKGNWNLVGKQINLHSELQPEDKPKSIISYLPKSDGQTIKIKIVDEDGEKLVGANCAFKKGESIVGGVVSNEEGECEILAVDSYDFIQISYVSYEEAIIKVSELTTNRIAVEMKKDIGFYHYFTNEKWKLKNGKLFDPKIKKDKYNKKNYYIRS